MYTLITRSSPFKHNEPCGGASRQHWGRLLGLRPRGPGRLAREMKCELKVQTSQLNENYRPDSIHKPLLNDCL
jgi:hypothetical protein